MPDEPQNPKDEESEPVSSGAEAVTEDETAEGQTPGDTPDDATSESEPVSSPVPKSTVTVNIDGVDHEAKPGQKVIDAAEDAGTYVPRFCYHHRMTPVGMCRQCLVEIEGPKGPMMVVSCMTDVADGQIVRTATPGIKAAQAGVIELLLANHPLDCPVCDKGGECPLQDQAVSNGPGESRYLEEKRHFEKPIPISDLVLLDRERCILCDRCTRFANEVAGDPLISFTYRGNETQVLTFPDEPFSSYFSGNTVQICPVGALTATPYRFKARPWDLEECESTCTTCAVGCRTVLQSTRDELIRYQGVDSDAVNWSWLCDRGRFNFQSLRSDDRLAEPMVRTAVGLVPTTWSSAMASAAELIDDALDAGGGESIAVLGGARGSNEDAFMWARLADGLQTPHRDAQLGDGLAPELLSLPRATISEAASAATVVVIGPDLKEELPVLYLRLRDAAQRRRSRIIELSPMVTGLTSHAWRSVRVEPGSTRTITATFDDDEVRSQLASGDVVVVAGRSNLAESEGVAAAAINAVLAACPGAKVLPALRRGNVFGAVRMGLTPQDGGLDGLGILQAAAGGKLECLVLLGVDPISDCPDADLARQALAGARRLIAVDTHLTESSKLAQVVLAASSYGEKSGTTTNIEGRVQTLAQKVTATGTTRPDWMLAAELMNRFGVDEATAHLETVDDVTDEIAATVPGFGEVTTAALGDTVDGIVAGPAGEGASELPLRTASTAETRISYDYRLIVSRKLYDQAVGTSRSPALAALAPGSAAHVHPLDLDRIGVKSGTEIRVAGARSAVVLPVVANDAVARGTVWVPFNQSGSRIADAIDAQSAIADVRLETL